MLREALIVARNGCRSKKTPAHWVSVPAYNRENFNSCGLGDHALQTIVSGSGFEPRQGTPFWPQAGWNESGDRRCCLASTSLQGSGGVALDTWQCLPPRGRTPHHPDVVMMSGSLLQQSLDGSCETPWGRWRSVADRKVPPRRVAWLGLGSYFRPSPASDVIQEVS